MARRTITMAALAATMAAALVPAAAVAQDRYPGGYGSPGYSGYGYADRGSYEPRYDDGRHGGWAAQERREERRAWKERQRFEREEARRYRHDGYRGDGYGYGYSRY